MKSCGDRKCLIVRTMIETEICENSYEICVKTKKLD